jgi:rhamnogalacturonyl hydrolase YesR
LARAFELTGDSLFADALAGLDDWTTTGLPRRADGVAYHEIGKPRIWADSMFMLPPFLARQGHVEDALHQIRGFWDTLHDPATGLLFHMWNEDLAGVPAVSALPPHRAVVSSVTAATSSPGGASSAQPVGGWLEWPDLWATGNGWALAGLAQVIPYATAADRTWLISLVETLLDGLTPFQCEDGLFHNILDRPETFVDAAGACLMAYAVFTGVADGWLDGRYAFLAWDALAGADIRIDEYGFVRGVPGAPFFETPGVSAEAQAAFLLARAAAIRLPPSRHTHH